MSFDWKNIVKTVAPVLGTALGGPAGGAALSILSQTILGKTGGTEEELAAVIAGGLKPEVMLALKQADLNFKIEMRKLDVEEERIAVDNTKDARGREIKIAESGKKDYTQQVLAYIAIVGFFGVIYALFAKVVPEGFQRDAFLIMLGTLAKIVGDLYNYYFGSSKGSEQKTSLIDSYIKRGR